MLVRIVAQALAARLLQQVKVMLAALALTGVLLVVVVVQVRQVGQVGQLLVPEEQEVLVLFLVLAAPLQLMRVVAVVA